MLFSPQGHSAQSPLAQFDEFDYSAQAKQPKSQIGSGYPTHMATAPGAQQLNLTSSTTLHRSCNIRVRSAQAIQPTWPQRSEPNSSVSRAQLLCISHAAYESDQLRLSSPHGHSARSPAAQFDVLDYSAQVMQPKSQISSDYPTHMATAPGAQQLSLTSSTTLHRSSNLRVRSAQAIQPTRPQRQEPSSSV